MCIYYIYFFLQVCNSAILFGELLNMEFKLMIHIWLVSSFFHLYRLNILYNITQCEVFHYSQEQIFYPFKAFERINDLEDYCSSSGLCILTSRSTLIVPTSFCFSIEVLIISRNLRHFESIQWLFSFEIILIELQDYPNNLLVEKDFNKKK